jgi:hypothetical protein
MWLLRARGYTRCHRRLWLEATLVVSAMERLNASPLFGVSRVLNKAHNNVCGGKF